MIEMRVLARSHNTEAIEGQEKVYLYISQLGPNVKS